MAFLACSICVELRRYSNLILNGKNMYPLDIRFLFGTLLRVRSRDFLTCEVSRLSLGLLKEEGRVAKQKAVGDQTCADY